MVHVVPAGQGWWGGGCTWHHIHIAFSRCFHSRCALQLSVLLGVPCSTFLPHMCFLNVFPSSLSTVMSHSTVCANRATIR